MNLLIWGIFLVDLILVCMLIFGWQSFGAITRRLMIALLVLVFPVMAAVPMNVESFSSMQKVDFCLRCHTMEKHGASLKADDNEILAAVHYQNNYVPKETACYSCHTDYEFFGGVKAKLTGLKHLWVYYFTNPPNPENLKTYHPYNVGNCLHCHGNSDRFMKKSNHNKEPGMLEMIKSGQKGCLTAGCHDVAHGVRDTSKDKPAEETAAPAPQASTTPESK